jgi:cation transport regulator
VGVCIFIITYSVISFNLNLFITNLQYCILMPYYSNKDLPSSVKEVLPTHGQDIFREAFNGAWEEYKSSDKRRDNRSQEETAFSVAWSAVEKKYKKDTQGKWVKI